jgi:hypothetical protein
MKIVLFLFVLSLSAISSFAQQINSSVVNEVHAYQEADTIIPARSYELDYIRDCLREYHKERQYSIITGGILFAASAGSLFVKSEDTQKTLLIAGGISGIVGLVFFVDAEKWIKRSTIKPSHTGAGIEIYFNKPKNKGKVTQKEYDDLYR